MKPYYENLMSPIIIRGKILKSRLLYPVAQPHFLQGPEIYPADPVVSFYTNKAKNGASMVMFQTLTNPNQRIMKGHDTKHFAMYDINDKGAQNYFSHLCSFVHYYGSLICCELSRDMSMKYAVNDPDKPNDGPSFGPPPVDLDGPEGPSDGIGGFPGTPIEGRKMFTRETIEEYIDTICADAVRLKNLGFDAGMVAIDSDFFCGQFLNPNYNTREDEFGGSFENRCRFPLMLLKRLRAAVGEDFIIMCNAPMIGESGPMKGLPMDEAVAFMKLIEPYCDLLHVRILTMFETGEHTVSPAVELAAQLKANGVTIPIAANTTSMDLSELDGMIADGKVDIISAGHMFLCNDNLGELIREGRGEDMNPCIECHACRGVSHKGDWVSYCTINPRLGMEYRADRMIEPAKEKKRVAVIGGGPGGMKCALYLKERGHTPVIFEASDALGGQIKTARYPEFKYALRRYLDFLIAQIEKNDIAVCLNTKATPELIEKQGFDVVVVCTGAEPKLPNVPGAENAKWNIVNIYGHENEIGKRVVVVGGSSGPSEAAIYLAGLGHEVTILSRKSCLCYDLNPIIARPCYNFKALGSGVNVVTLAKTTEITANSVTYTDQDGNSHTVECDDILAAGGMTPNNQAAVEFYGCAKEFYAIGDCRKAGNMRNAIRDAYAVAMQI